MRELNPKEDLVIINLVNAWNSFLDLPNSNGDDAREFRAGIHRLQEKIMSRPYRIIDEIKEPIYHFCMVKLCHVKIYNEKEDYCKRHQSYIDIGIKV